MAEYSKAKLILIALLGTLAVLGTIFFMSTLNNLWIRMTS